ncbi:MAG: hypothetical protein U0Q15_04125 [Kineosporiaceae bacterium]
MGEKAPAEPGPTTGLPEGLRPRYPRTFTGLLRMALRPRVLALFFGLIVVVAALRVLGLPSWAATPIVIGASGLILSAVLTRHAQTQAQQRTAEAATRRPSDVELAEVPLPTSEALRAPARQMWTLLPVGLAVSALALWFAVRPPEDDAADRGLPPEWVVRLVGAAVGIGVVVALAGGLRQWRRRRAVQQLIEAGQAPRHGGVVVGETGFDPVVELADGALVSLTDGSRPIRELAQADVVVIDGVILDGHPVAVSVGGRVGWAQMQSLPVARASAPRWDS